MSLFLKKGFLFFVFLAILFSNCKLVFAATLTQNSAKEAKDHLLDPTKALSKKRLCNTNDHCRTGYYCMNGTAQNGYQSPTGYCLPSGPVRFICLIMQILSYVIVPILALITFIFTFGKVIIHRELPQIGMFITFAMSIVLGVAPYYIVIFIFRMPYSPCDMTGLVWY